jgi:hypothetical protein
MSEPVILRPSLKAIPVAPAANAATPAPTLLPSNQVVKVTNGVVDTSRNIPDSVATQAAALIDNRSLEEVIRANGGDPTQRTAKIAPVQDISELSPERQAAIQAALAPKQRGEAFIEETYDNGSVTTTNSAAGGVQPAATFTEDDLAGLEDDEDAETPTADSATVTLPKICPCCGWDTAQPYTIKIKDTDIYKFLATQQSLGRQRYMKKIDVMNGEITFTFREPTTRELREISKQLDYDVRSGSVATETAYRLREMTYRMVASLAVVEVVAQGSSPGMTTEIPGIMDHAALSFTPPKPPDPPATAIPALLDWLEANVLTSETLYLMAERWSLVFYQHTRELAARVQKASFSNGIESPA